MRQFIQHHCGYSIYRWSTGKFEAYLDSKSSGLAAHTLDQLIAKIDEVESREN